MITNHHEITRSDLVQESLSNLPLGSFYLHRNIWQQTRHLPAVIQHVILTHILWWQPLFTPFHAHEWWPAKQNFKWAQVCFYSLRFGKASTHFDHMSTITRQCFCFPQGVNSMKSIIRYSNGPAGAGWDAKGVFIPLATLCVFTSDASFAKIFSNHCKPLCKP